MISKTTKFNGLRDIKTMHNGSKRSIPRVQSSGYLSLYMMRMEMDRLEKERYLLDKRKITIQKRIRDMQDEMETLQKAEADNRKGLRRRPPKPASKTWKAMAVNY